MRKARLTLFMYLRNRDSKLTKNGIKSFLFNIYSKILFSVICFEMIDARNLNIIYIDLVLVLINLI